MAKEPCVSCGEETTTGSPWYSSRRLLKAKDGHQGYLCGGCHSTITGHERQELTEKELATLRSSGAAFGAWFMQGH